MDRRMDEQIEGIPVDSGGKNEFGVFDFGPFIYNMTICD